MTLGQRIQARRVELGLSQEGLGERMGVSRQAVSKWEADGAVPDTDKLIALSKLFGISLNELLQVENPPKATEGREARRRRLKNVGHVLTGLLVVAVLGALCLQWGQIRTLSARVAALEAAADAVAVQSAGMDRSAPLVAFFDYGLTSDISVAGRAVTLELTLIAAQPVEGLTVSFTATHNQGRQIKTVEAESMGGGSYHAVLDLSGPVELPLTVSACFNDGGGQVVAPLVSISGISNNSWTWDLLWKE